MGLPRSTFYEVPAAPVGDVELVAKIVVISDEFETYGYRRVRAELRHQGFVAACNRSAADGTSSRPTAITRVRFSPICRTAGANSDLFSTSPPKPPSTRASLDRAKLRGREGHCSCALHRTGDET